MALETLKTYKQIDGFNVMRNADRPTKEDGSVDWDAFDIAREKSPISINDEQNMISFKLQDGPVLENGENGCQLTTLIKTATIMLKHLNEKFPCRENAITLTKLQEALMWQDERTMDRNRRGVEGKSEA